jgi:UDP-GalNAc:undecaprenyl-phosphate GalNAc-1-phosphate transferase
VADPPLMIGAVAGYVVCATVVRYIRRFALVNLWASVVFVVAVAAVADLLIVGAVTNEYLPVFHGVFYAGTLMAMAVWIRIIKKVQYLRLAMIPAGMTSELAEVDHPQLSLSWIGKLETDHLQDRMDGIVIDTREPLSADWVRFVGQCRLKGLRAYQAEELFEAITGRISLAHLSQGIVDGFSRNITYLPAKRLLDILGAIVTLPITLPLMLLTALAIRVESPGPVLFVQNRIGQGGEPFEMLKFRSMYTDAERHGPRFAVPGDSRITRVGTFIRRFRLDELPQLWNVFKGEMSLIGPRPEQPSFVEEFNEAIPYYAYRHIVKPGLTGWAQVSQGYAADEESTRDKLEYDLYYIKHQSFWLDLIIVLKTLRTIATGFGAR